MTDVCRFNFDAVWVAVFHSSNGCRSSTMAIGLLIAVRTNHSLSHDGESFFRCRAMLARRRNRPQGVQMISARKFFCCLHQTAAHVDIMQPRYSLEGNR